MRHSLFVILNTFIFFNLSAANAAMHALPLKGENILNNAEVLAGQKKSKGLVVVFLSSKCPCSDSHIEELKELSKDFADFEFVGVHSNADEDIESSKNYFESKKLPFLIIQDNDTKIADSFKAFKTPHAYVLKSTGEVLYQGGVTNSAQFSTSNKKFLRLALQDISSEREVQISEGRTLGCVIARSK